LSWSVSGPDSRSQHPLPRRFHRPRSASATSSIEATEAPEPTATNDNKPEPTEADTPPASDPPAPAPSAELAHEDDSITPAIVAAAGYCLKSKTTAETALAVSPEIIGQGRVLYLKDGTNII
jgi:hypothetical protein